MMEIEIDPQLFVTCRLCMKNGATGMFQIIPTIQEQIRYCFEIEVNPFDGLPQLICKMCRLTLNDFFTKKKLFKYNQESLQTSLSLKKDKKDAEDISNQPQQESLSTNSEHAREIHSNKDKEEKSPHFRPKKRRIKLISSSSSDDMNDETFFMTSNKTCETKITCPENYSLFYRCKFCSYEARIKQCILDHFRKKHQKLMEIYKNVITKQCRISLNKIDGEINETERKDLVTINKRIILHDTYNPHYFIYFIKDFCAEEQSPGDEIAKSGKRIRLLSKSSNETVVLGNVNKSPILSVTDTAWYDTTEKDSLITINIDDSSNESVQKETIPADESNIEQTDMENYKSIQTLISMCYNKYLRKRCFLNKDTGSKQQLKHKILSIGRKVINKRWFNCNGILRYVENKNLKIDWIKATTENDNNYVKINIKEKGQEKLKNGEWQDVNAGFSNEQKRMLESKIWSQSNDVEDPVFEDDCFNNPDKVILNSSPVPNPKQLPKKNVGLEPVSTYINKKASLSLANIGACHIVPAYVKADQNDTMHLPIITSTTSLATTQKENKDNEKTNSDIGSVSKEKGIPRIKVKPVSELMANNVNDHYDNLLRKPWNASYRIDERRPHIPCPDSLMRYNNVKQLNSEASNSQICNSNVLSEKNDSPSNIVFIQNNGIPSQTTALFSEQQVLNPVQTTAPLAAETTNMTTSGQIAPSTTKTSDYMILDTVELPNTKTYSPYTYLKDLLRIHDINLHDSSETLPADFVSLIKFSLQFHQVLNTNKTEHQVKLMLSLLCSRNHFCLRIRDKNQLTIDINKLSPNWQWQILKTCTGNVGSKFLQNAQKHSQTAHEYTKKVLCLLRSIKIIEI